VCIFKQKIKNLQICGSYKSATNLGQQIENQQIAKNSGSANRNPHIATHAKGPQM
jgi:hypothetical protein